MEEEHTISTLWEQDGCSEICSKEELWQAAKSDEMQIQLRGGDDVSGASEQQYEERFWRRRLDGIALDSVGKKCYLIEFKRTRDRRHSYEERAMKVARQQYKSLLSGLQSVGQQKGAGGRRARRVPSKSKGGANVCNVAMTCPSTRTQPSSQ